MLSKSKSVPNMGFQYSAEYRIFHCSIWPNTNTNMNSCWTEKENELKSITCKTRSVLHIIHSALVVTSLHTVKYFHSRLRQLSIIHNNYGSIKIRAVTQYYSTRTDRRSADYSIDQAMALLPKASGLGPPQTRHFLIPISRHAIYTAVGQLQPGVRC